MRADCPAAVPRDPLPAESHDRAGRPDREAGGVRDPRVRLRARFTTTLAELPVRVLLARCGRLHDGITVSQLDKRRLIISLPGDPEAVASHLHEAACESFRLHGATIEDGTLTLVLTREGP